MSELGTIEKLARLSQTALQGLKVRSALNPVLWLCGITMSTCFVGAYYLTEPAWLRPLLAIVGLFPLITACGVFIYFAVKKPEKLQSEEYQLRHQTLQMIEVKADITGINSKALEAISGATIRSLPRGGGEVS